MYGRCKGYELGMSLEDVIELAKSMKTGLESAKELIPGKKEEAVAPVVQPEVKKFDIKKYLPYLIIAPVGLVLILGIKHFLKKKGV